MNVLRTVLSSVIGAGAKLRLRLALGRHIHARLRKNHRPWPARPTATTLVFAPHPDDEALGCGGLIAHRAGSGETVHVVFITDGAASHPGHPLHAPEDISALRAKEARLAAGILGVPQENLAFLNAPDGRLPHLDTTRRTELVAAISRLIGRIAPDEILITSRHDGSTEHAAASRLLRDALAATPGPQPRLLEYLVWSRWNPLLVRPAFASPVAIHCHRLSEKEAGLKHEAIHVYRSQIEALAPWPRAVLPEGFVRMFNEPEEFFFEFKNT